MMLLRSVSGKSIRASSSATAKVGISDTYKPLEDSHWGTVTLTRNKVTLPGYGKVTIPNAPEIIF